MRFSAGQTRIDGAEPAKMSFCQQSLSFLPENVYSVQDEYARPDSFLNHFSPIEP